MPKISALIFDFDGLIVDTETPVFESWKALYADHGHELTLDVWSQCVGSDFGHYDPIAELEKLSGKNLDREVLEKRRSEESRRLSKTSETLPGVKPLLEEAESADLPRAIASSSPSNWVIPWLERLEIDHHFHAIRTLDHVARPKPDPELFLAAAAALDVDPAEALVFEDSLNGLRAATAAGMRCVIVPGPVTASLDFTGATLRLDSLSRISLDHLLRSVDRTPR